MEPTAFQSPQARMLDGYEAVATATRRMLDAARAADWNALDENARDCETSMQRIARLGDPDAVLDAQGRRRRIEILCRVLRDDAQIRDLMHPSLGQVDRWFRHSGLAALR